MSFPVTRHSLIQRLAQGGGEADWQEFLDDYWGAVCRFARRSGNLSAEDSEDVAAQTFDTILRGQLLERWTATRTAKLRTLLCAVVRNILSNRFRLENNRSRLVREHGGQLERYEYPDAIDDPPTSEQQDGFYAAWADELLHTAVEGLMEEYRRTARADYFRVLYGRLCEQMTMPEIAQSLKISLSAVENYFRHARARLTESLQALVRKNAQRYAAESEVRDEFEIEWGRLGAHLQRDGGLENAVRTAVLEAPSTVRRVQSR